MAGMYDYDEELPAGYQEADLLQRQYEQESREFSKMQAAGFCMHNSWVGLPSDGPSIYPEQEGLTGSQVRCTAGCGQVFESDEAIVAAEPTKLTS